MPAILYGAPWQMGDGQPEAYRAAGFEPLEPNASGREPYIFVGGRKLLTGDRLLIARDGESPLTLTVCGTDPFYGYVRVTISTVCPGGVCSPALVLPPGTFVKRPEEKAVALDEQAEKQGRDEDG